MRKRQRERETRVRHVREIQTETGKREREVFMRQMNDTVHEVRSIP